jgi:plasmid maintenance system antidote protein VapI
MDNTTDARLKTIREKWSQLQLTQAEAAKQMGITQPCFNQYLRGRIPLNTDTIIKFATLFNVAPSEIDPRIY